MATVLHTGVPGAGTKAVWVHVHGGAFGGGEHARGDRFIMSCRGRFQPGILFVAAEVLTDNLKNTVEHIVATCRGFAQADVPLILSGSSSGGYHAVEAAKQMPGELAALILLCPVTNPHVRKEYLEDCLLDVPVDDFLPSGVDRLARTAAAKIKALQDAFGGLEPRAFEFPTDMPSLLIAGRKDKNVPLCSLDDTIDGATESFILNAGHDLEKALTDDTAGLIRRFLRTAGVYGGDEGGDLIDA